jgi:hypothetical protein
VIVPFVSQPPLLVGGTAASGVSDILTSFFFPPNTGSTFTWGAGPVMSLPSTTEPRLGTEKWSAGPTIVVLKQAGSWTVGALWNQLWSFSGNTSREDVNQMFILPFLAYTTNNALTITVQSKSVANFKAATDHWTVPINLLFSKVATFGTFPSQLSGRLRRVRHPSRPRTLMEDSRSDHGSAAAEPRLSASIC